MFTEVNADELARRLSSGGELALLDAREQGVFARSHLFHATCVPLSQLELILGDLVPRRSTPIVWCDRDGVDGGSATRAAAKASELGWTEHAVLAGGTKAWAEAGGQLYSGIDVPSKALAEYIAQTFDTPSMAATDVRALMDSTIDGGPGCVVLDSRPAKEFRRRSIPGGICCPGAELVHRVKGVAPDPDTWVIVTGAERSQGIIGAQSLINAGLENRVAVLDDGMVGWELAGLELNRGDETAALDPGSDAMAWAETAAAGVGARFGVRSLSIDDVDLWRTETARTTYLLDVRTPAEFEAGHLEGSRNTPGGQLVEATGGYVATRGARLVLIDDNEARAMMTGSWMRQLGWAEVAVLAGGLPAVEAAGVSLRTGPRARVRVDPVPTMRVSELATLLADRPESVAVLDIGTSLKYLGGHIVDAWWGVRSRLDEARAAIIAGSHSHSAAGPGNTAGGAVETLVITSTDGHLAKLAVPEAAALWPEATVMALAGGNKGWRHGGHGMSPGFDRATTSPDDVWYRPSDHHDTTEAIHQHMRDQLGWAAALLGQIGCDPIVEFPRFR